jgi:hypothetical protein
MGSSHQSINQSILVFFICSGAHCGKPSRAAMAAAEQEEEKAKG